MQEFLLYFLSPMPAPVWSLSDLLGFKSCQVPAGPLGHGTAYDYNLAPFFHSLPGIVPDGFCNFLSFHFLKYSMKEIEFGFQWAEAMCQDELPTRTLLGSTLAPSTLHSCLLLGDHRRVMNRLKERSATEPPAPCSLHWSSFKGCQKKGNCSSSLFCIIEKQK